MNLHDIVSKLGFLHITNGKEIVYVEGIFAIGDFDGVYDYEKGLVYVKIKNPFYMPGKFSENPIVIISSIDDSIWHGYGESPVDVVEIAKQWEKKFGVKLPSEKQLNDFLCNFGIVGKNVD